MTKLYYCLSCKRVGKNEEQCSYCSEKGMKELCEGAPVSIIGTKTKGNVLKVMEENVRLLVRDQSNQKMIKEYEWDKLKKVL